MDLDQIPTPPKRLPVDAEAAFEAKERNIEFIQAAEEVISAGDALMAKNHDSGPKQKEFHTSGHPRTLKYRAEVTAQIFELSNRRMLLSKIIINYHDTIINFNPAAEYDPTKPETMVSMIMRHRGAREGDKPNGENGNEALSAKAMVEEMRKKLDQDGNPIFTEEEIATAVLAVDATYPDVELGKDFQGAEFKKDPYYAELTKKNPDLGKFIDSLEERGITKGIKFTQPHLENLLENGKCVPEEVLAMAMSDLGGCGIMRPEEFFEEGNSEFRELYSNIRKHLAMLTTDKSKDKERAIAVKAMQGWMNSQARFATWQMIRFEKIVYLLRENGQIKEEDEKDLRDYFSQYTSNINASLDRVERVNKILGEERDEMMGFVYMAEQMGY